MSRFQFSKWQWIGLLSSLLWMVFAINADYKKTFESATNYAQSTYESCAEKQAKNPPMDLKKCETEKNNDYELFMNNAWSGAFANASIPLVLVWLYGFIFYKMGHSLYVGYGTVVNFSQLSKSKKAFAYFCYLIVALTIFIILMAYLESLVREKVPVSLGNNFRIFNHENRHVEAQGTWKSVKKNGESNMIYPQQTSKIVCKKESGKCYEARAMITAGYNAASVMVDLKEYEIVSWAAAAIVFKSKDICVYEIYTIDLLTESVNGTDRYENNPNYKDYCKQQPKNYEPTTYRLVDGEEVYDELKKKASPWLQRVVFSVFSN